MAVTVTFSTMKSNLGLLLDDPNANTYSASTKGIAINLARQHVQDVVMHWGAKPLISRTTINIVADTVEYAIDKEIKWIEKVTVLRTDGSERTIDTVEFVDAEDFTDPLVSPNNDFVMVYYRKANNIGFLPTPQKADTAYVYHSSMQDDFSADGDVLVLQPWMRDLVLFRAAELCAITKGDTRTANSYANQYAKTLREKEVVLAHWQSQAGDQVRAVWEGDEINYAGEVVP